MNPKNWLERWRKSQQTEPTMKPEPIVWVDEEPANRRPSPPPAPPPIKRTATTPKDVQQEKLARDLLIAVKMLSRDTIDFLMFNDCGHTQEGLRERHMILVEMIEELEG